MVEINKMKIINDCKSEKFKYVRSYNNFSQDDFNCEVASQEWEKLRRTKDLDEMVHVFFDTCI